MKMTKKKIMLADIVKLPKSLLIPKGYKEKKGSLQITILDKLASIGRIAIPKKKR